MRFEILNLFITELDMTVRLGEMGLTLAVHRGKVLAIIWQKLQKRGPPDPLRGLFQTRRACTYLDLDLGLERDQNLNLTIVFFYLI